MQYFGLMLPLGSSGCPYHLSLKFQTLRFNAEEISRSLKMLLLQAPWVKVITTSLQVDAAAVIDTSGTAPDGMKQNGVDNPSGGDLII